MPATTPTNGLPYPLGTDRVMDGDDAIKALAEALDPPWTALPLGANMSARAGFAAPGCRLVGTKKVELRGGITKSSALVSADVLGTLPAAMRPAVASHLVGAGTRTGSAGSPTVRIDIAATTGVITVQVDTNATNGTSVCLDGCVFWLS